MKPIKTFRSVVAPIKGRNIDTDQIIPARFLKMNRQAQGGYGPYLFHDSDHMHLLNSQAFKNSTIVVAEQNFGCGSSREGAVYAFVDRGFQAVLAPSFGDIFFNNCLKNGLLPIQLSESIIAELFDDVKQSKQGLVLEVDLERQEVSWEIDVKTKKKYPFLLDPFWRECLLKGLDEIELTQSYLREIEEFEQAHKKMHPWLYV